MTSLMNPRKSINWNNLETGADVPQATDDSMSNGQAARKTPVDPEYGESMTRADDARGSLILVADDDPMILFLARESLEGSRFEVVQADNGKAALELIAERPPDLIICDVMMPELDGFDLCTAVRSTKQGEHVPIVMLTGLNDTESIRRAFSVGATDFCEKPVNWALLPYKLNYILRASSAFSDLLVSEERYALVAHGANDGLWDWDLNRDEVYFSPRWKAMLGFDDAAIGCDVNEWISRIHGDDRQRVVAELEAHKNGKTPHFGSEYRIENAAGEYRWMMCRSLAVTDDDGRAYRMTGSQTDITERKQAEEKLVFDALHDALTGLPNRTLFLDRLSHCIELYTRRQNFSFAVLYLDLDRFKIVNDSLGHLLGDRLLVEVGNRIKQVLRKGDTLSRLGGDEFTILCEDIDDITTATKLAERIQKQLLQPIDLDGQKVSVGCSIGITESGKDYQRPEDMLRDADAAMYRAKASSGGHYEIFDQTMHQKAMNVLRTESDLRLALELEEFDVYFQPIAEVESNAVCGFEALVRWNHPQRGLMVPRDFLEVAIDSRLIVPLGRWVLTRSCRQLKEWKDTWEAASDWTVSVNLSAPELAQPDLLATIDGILQDCGLDAGSLKLEITETSLIKNSEHALKTMNALRDRGIRLSIDDFGTGYSSFSYLHQFPFDTLKVDKSFITDIDKHPDREQIVKTIVSLAHNLGMTVVAEGTESDSAYQRLKGVACEYAQGFSILEPSPAADMTRFLADHLESTD